jgi:hypothetical protein
MDLCCPPHDFVGVTLPYTYQGSFQFPIHGTVSWTVHRSGGYNPYGIWSDSYLNIYVRATSYFIRSEYLNSSSLFEGEEFYSALADNSTGVAKSVMGFYYAWGAEDGPGLNVKSTSTAQMWVDTFGSFTIAKWIFTGAEDAGVIIPNHIYYDSARAHGNNAYTGEEFFYPVNIGKDKEKWTWSGFIA